MRVAPNPMTEKKRHPSITSHDNGSRDWTGTPKSQGTLRPVGSKQHLGRGREDSPAEPSERVQPSHHLDFRLLA